MAWSSLAAYSVMKAIRAARFDWDADAQAQKARRAAAESHVDRQVADSKSEAEQQPEKVSEATVIETVIAEEVEEAAQKKQEEGEAEEVELVEVKQEISAEEEAASAAAVVKPSRRPSKRHGTRSRVSASSPVAE